MTAFLMYHFVTLIAVHHNKSIRFPVAEDGRVRGGSLQPFHLNLAPQLFRGSINLRYPAVKKPPSDWLAGSLRLYPGSRALLLTSVLLLAYNTNQRSVEDLVVLPHLPAVHRMKSCPVASDAAPSALRW